MTAIINNIGRRSICMIMLIAATMITEAQNGTRYGDVPTHQGYYEPFNKDIGSGYLYLGTGFVHSRIEKPEALYAPLQFRFGAVLPFSINNMKYDKEHGQLTFKDGMYLQWKAGIAMISGYYGLKKGYYPTDDQYFAAIGLNPGMGVVKNLNNKFNIEANVGFVHVWNNPGDYWETGNFLFTSDLSVRSRKWKLTYELLNMKHKPETTGDWTTWKAGGIYVSYLMVVL